MIVIAIESTCLKAFPLLAQSLDCDSFIVFSVLSEVDRQKHPLVMLFHEGCLSLSILDNKQALYVNVDFVSGRSLYRNRHKTLNNELLAKAVGLKSNLKKNLHILDATAGFGRDSFLLASFGCKVLMLERSPLMAALLLDGLQRTKNETECSGIVKRMELVHGDALSHFQSLDIPSDNKGNGLPQPDVIYLDPMFPGSNKTAQVKKEMRILRYALGEDFDGEHLIESAIASGVKRVVVKRPKKGVLLGGAKPSHQVLGKSSRFDVYFP